MSISKQSPFNLKIKSILHFLFPFQAVGRDSNARMDITHLYKYPAGSADADEALQRAHPRSNHHIKRLVKYMEDNEPKMTCSFVVSPETCLADAGCECSATLEVRSNGLEELDLEHVAIHVGAFTYSGWPIARNFRSA